MAGRSARLGRLKRYLLAGVGPAAAPLRFRLDERWAPAQDIGDVDLFVVAGPVDDALGAAALELRTQLAADVPTLWLCAPGEERNAQLLVALARPAPLRVAEIGAEEDLDAALARATAVARSGGDPFAHETRRLFEPEGEGDLATEDLVLSLGPIHPALATPLRIILVLDGEQVRDVIRDEGYARRKHPAGARRGRDRSFDPATPATARLAVALAAGDPRDVGPLVVAAERERAAHHLLACARHLWLLGMVPRARELASLAREAQVGREPLALAARTDRVRAALRSPLGPVLRMRGVGTLAAARVRGASVSGPVARASGVAVDARQDGALAAVYERLRFAPVMAPGASGDDAARFDQRLAEAAQAMRLAAAVADADLEPFERRGGTVDIESPRGRLTLARDGELATAVTPSAALLAVLPELLVGARYGDALVLLDGLDASAEEAEMAA